jgi:hypothetical protein
MDSEQPLDPRRREAHPERITVGGEDFLRNDVQAKELGCSERSIDRGDKLGAPYLLLAGIKYRPVKRYAEFILGRIQVRKPQPHKRSQKKTRKRT